MIDNILHIILVVMIIAQIVVLIQMIYNNAVTFKHEKDFWKTQADQMKRCTCPTERAEASVAKHVAKHAASVNSTSFSDWLDDNWDETNMFAPPLNAQLAVDFLQNYLLGEDWFTTLPTNCEQANTEIVHDILTKYSHKYRTEVAKKIHK